MAVTKAKTFLHYTVPASRPSLLQRFLGLFPMYQIPAQKEKSNPKKLKAPKPIYTKKRGKSRKKG